MYNIFPEIRVIGLHFALIMWVYVYYCSRNYL